MIQAKDLLVVSSYGASSQLNNLHSAAETNFSATFKPGTKASDSSHVELIIHGIGTTIVRGPGLYPNTVFKGKIRIESYIAKVPNSYLIARVGNDLIFLFRAGSTNEIIGGATFPYPNVFGNDIDWYGNVSWKPLVPITPKLDGSTLNATPE